MSRVNDYKEYSNNPSPAEIRIITIGETFFLNISLERIVKTSKLAKIIIPFKSKDSSSLIFASPIILDKNKVVDVDKISPTTQGLIPARKAFTPLYLIKLLILKFYFKNFLTLFITSSEI